MWSKWFSTATLFSLVSSNDEIYGEKNHDRSCEIYTGYMYKIRFAKIFIWHLSFLNRSSKGFFRPSGLRESGV